MPLVDNGHGFLIDTDDPGEPGYDETRQRWSVHETETALLSALAKGRYVFEIGTGYGVATRALAKYALRVLTCDIDPTIQTQVHPVLRSELGIKVDCLSERRPNEAGGDYGLIFVDGCHVSEAVASDTRWAAQNLAQGGLIVWHDWNIPDVRQGVTEALADSSWFVIEIPSPAGMAIGFPS